MKLKEQIGKKYNSMKILEILNAGKVKCECDCGNIKICNFQDLKRESPKEDRGFKYLLRKIKNGFNRKESSITIEDLKNVWHKQNGICPYTKIKLILPTSANPNPDISYNIASVDRIDSNESYTKNNIQFVSRNINYAKNNMTHEQTLNFIKIITENNKV